MGNKILDFLRGIIGLVQTLIVLVIFGGYSFVLLKAGAQAGVNAQNNPLKQRVLSTVLGVEPPKETKLFGCDLKALREGRCDSTEESDREGQQSKQPDQPVLSSTVVETVSLAPPLSDESEVAETISLSPPLADESEVVEKDTNNAFYLALLDVMDKARFKGNQAEDSE